MTFIYLCTLLEEMMWVNSRRVLCKIVGELLLRCSVSVSHAACLAHWSVSCSECVCALTCLCSGVWGQRMLFQGHCWCGTKWTSPGGRPITSGRPLAVSTTAVTSLLGHTEQTLFDTAWLWWIAAIGLCCLFAPEKSSSGFSVKLCVATHTRGKCHNSDKIKVTFFFF